MGHKHFVRKVSGPGFSLGLWSCTLDHRGPGAEQSSDCAVINVPLGGVFLRHLGRSTLVVDPTSAVLTGPGESWRSSHPVGGGDRGVWVELYAGARELGAGPLPPQRIRPLPPRAPLDWARAAATGDRELALVLIADILGEARLPLREPPYVRRARMILADRLRDPPALEALAAEVRTSPWHLCRTFRAVTGATPRAYAERLRLLEAAARIEAGRVDLTELAASLGFASHSHLTARFRAAFGRTPSAHRKDVTAPDPGCR